MIQDAIAASISRSLYYVIASVVALVVVVVVGDALSGPSSDDAYLRGQRDAFNGVWKYEMQKQPTGEVLWVEKQDK